MPGCNCPGAVYLWVTMWFMAALVKGKPIVMSSMREQRIFICPRVQSSARTARM